MTIKVEGLRELVAALEQADARFLPELDEIHRTISRLVVQEAEREAPRRSGRLASSLRARGSPKSATVAGGGRTVPYFGVQEFGGTVPKRGRPGAKGPGMRTRMKPYRGGAGAGVPWWEDEGAGYFLYPAGRRLREHILELYAEALEDITKRAFPK